MNAAHKQANQYCYPGKQCAPAVGKHCIDLSGMVSCMFLSTGVILRKKIPFERLHLFLCFRFHFHFILLHPVADDLLHKCSR